jgi:hypothetical protein
VTIDPKAELKRPVPVALAIVALLGWIVAVYFVWSVSSLRNSSTRQIDQIAAFRQQLATELDQQRQAAGTLAELQKKATETEAAIDQATRERHCCARSQPAGSAASTSSPRPDMVRAGS